VLGLTIKLHEIVQIGDEISFLATRNKGGQVRLVFRAPQDKIIIRGEFEFSSNKPRQRPPGKGVGLSLTRAVGQSVLIGENIRVTLLKIVTRKKVSVGIYAPKEIRILHESAKCKESKSPGV
jgi:carbon storage regulator CsrA